MIRLRVALAVGLAGVTVVGALAVTSLAWFAPVVAIACLLFGPAPAPPPTPARAHTSGALRSATMPPVSVVLIATALGAALGLAYLVLVMQL